MNLETILKKASKARFHGGGDCFTTTYCISRYIKDTLDIELKTHVGVIQSKKHLTPHVWSSYEGKLIDLASFRQPHERVQALILGKPITPKGNAKRVPSYKVYEGDINIIIAESNACVARGQTAVASYLCAIYSDKGVVPYDVVMEMHDEKLEAMYQEFLSYMKETV